MADPRTTQDQVTQDQVTQDQTTRDRDGATTGPTGDGPVDDALARLADVDARETADQVAVFEDVHAALRDRLADAEG